MAQYTTVEFGVHGDQVLGHLFRPDGDGPFPAVVVEGPLTSVKEQVASNYAKVFKAHGYIALAFDHRFFGESGGTPRQYECPPKKVEDLEAALDYLASRPDVNASRLFLMGVCAGAGYGAAVAARGKVRAFGAVAGFMHDARQQAEWMGAEQLKAAIAVAVQAQREFEHTGEVKTIPAVASAEDRNAIDVAMPLDEAFEYYGTARGAVPNYKNEFALLSRKDTLVWDSMRAANRITVPTLMIHSENALSPMLARRFFERVAGPKKMVWTESKGQIDFYDDPRQIEPAVERLVDHFQSA